MVVMHIFIRKVQNCHRKLMTTYVIDMKLYGGSRARSEENENVTAVPATFEQNINIQEDRQPQCILYYG